MVITDSQVHLWEAHRSDRPWPAEEIEQKVFIAAIGARPHREEPLGAQEMVSVMDQAGVKRVIIVMEHGRAVESGSHDELAAANGTYARLLASGTDALAP